VTSRRVWRAGGAGGRSKESSDQWESVLFFAAFQSLGRNSP
jgi:hypothetical protein